MFKKPVTSAAASLLSGKDLKKLKLTLERSYPSIAEDDVKALLPTKAEVTQSKLNNKTVIYCVNGGNALFFDPDGRGDYLLPTVYALWIAPNMLPRIYTHSEVTPKVLGGADLFLQGVIMPPGGLPPLAAGDVCSIAILENPYPFAVGTTHVDARAAVACGMKGKGVRLLHHYGDTLWQLGDGSGPHPSFTLQRIFPMEQQDGVAAVTDRLAQVDGKEDADVVNEEVVEDRTAQCPPVEQAAASTATNDTLTDLEPCFPVSEGTAANGSGSTTMDRLVEQCLLAGLAAVPDSVLPILTSDFYAKYMLPSRPEGSSVDVKKSSYKKLSKLLTKYEKLGVLKQKVVFKQEKLSHVHRTHELLQGLPAEVAEASSAATANSSSGKNAEGKVDISYAYRVPATLRLLFSAGSPMIAKEAMFSRDEAAEHLLTYAKHHHLLQSDGVGIKLDSFLASNLYKKGEGVMLDDIIPLPSLVEQLLPKLMKYHRVARVNATGETVEVVNRGDLKRIKISVEDRQGGRKHLTKIAGLEGFAVDPDELAALLQRKFAANCSVTKLPGKVETNKEIAAQGALGKEIMGFLGSEFGIGAEHIDLHQKGK